MIETSLKIIQDDDRAARLFIFMDEDKDFFNLLNAHIDVHDYQRLTKPMIFFPITEKPAHGQVLRTTFFIHPSAMPQRIDPPFLINDLFFEHCLGGMIDQFDLLNVEGQFHKWFNEVGMKPIGVYDEAEAIVSAIDNYDDGNEVRDNL